MSNYDTLDELISARRDDIYEWATDRFKQLMAEDRLDDALALADEFYEWLDPEQLHSEETLFYNEEQLQQYFIELTEG